MGMPTRDSTSLKRECSRMLSKSGSSVCFEFKLLKRLFDATTGGEAFCQVVRSASVFLGEREIIERLVVVVEPRSSKRAHIVSAGHCRIEFNGARGFRDGLAVPACRVVARPEAVE